MGAKANQTAFALTGFLPGDRVRTKTDDEYNKRRGVVLAIDPLDSFYWVNVQLDGDEEGDTTDFAACELVLLKRGKA